MIKFLFAFLLFLHGAIHLMGFIKAFSLISIDHQLKLYISKPLGILWLICGLLFFYLAFLYLIQDEDWFYIALAGVLTSQTLVFVFWSDAKAASLFNLLIISVALVAYANVRFESSYKQDVRNTMDQTSILTDDLVTPDDLTHLPDPVKRYLEYVGVVGKPKVKNVRVQLEGKMRRGSWFRFTSEQHNFFELPSRHFFMKSRINGLPTYGYHLYERGNAQMTIKLMSLFNVVSLQNAQLVEAETVTFLNDMCILAPAALIDKRIQWQEINDTSAGATYSNGDIAITATLHFNTEGQLINFTSEDRYEINDMKQYGFSTPIGAYKEMNGLQLASFASAIWHYPDRDFLYGEFNVHSVEYNVLEVE